MARACVIVLDAVGAGELPGRGRVRRRGLGHARQRRARRRRPRPADARGARARERRAARGLPAAAGRAGGRRPAARALARQGHDDRPLGADGDRHAAGDADVSARLPGRGDRPVHEPHRPRRARQPAGERHGDHPGARRGAPAHGQVDRLHERRLGLPDRRARGDDPARGAVRGLPRRARDPHRQARGRARDRAAVRRRAGELRAHGEPPRLLARAAAAELPLARPRGREEGLRRREDPRHLRRLRHRRVVPDEVERRGDPAHRGAAARRSTTASCS